MKKNTEQKFVCKTEFEQLLPFLPLFSFSASSLVGALGSRRNISGFLQIEDAYRVSWLWWTTGGSAALLLLSKTDEICLNDSTTKLEVSNGVMKRQLDDTKLPCYSAAKNSVHRTWWMLNATKREYLRVVVCGSTPSSWCLTAFLVFVRLLQSGKFK